MNKPLRILAICNYPSNTRPAHQVFVRALLNEFSGLGAEVTVIAPEPIWNLFRSRTGYRLPPKYEVRDGLPVHRPRYLRFSNLPLPSGGNTYRWGVKAYVDAVLNEIRNIKEPFDYVYGHFLFPHGQAVSKIGSELGIPTLISLGESSFSRYEKTYTNREIGQLLDRFSGVVANSSLIKAYCAQHYDLDEDKVRVFPNGVDEDLFFPHERQQVRQKLGLPADRPVVVFTGQFIERKGPLRVLEAIESIPEVGAVFLGYGPQVPESDQVLFQGEVSHEDVPLWLSAGDVFVLPTLNEGCSNSILEALFCGLPIISSDLPFNHDILDEQVAILVDPLDVQAIERSILALVKYPERRKDMSQAALERAQMFRLKNRAEKILNYMQELDSNTRN